MIYIHVPFCRSFCTYCGFYSEAAPEGALSERRFEQWAEAVESEIERRQDEISKSLKVNTLYIGGGTPSVLPASLLQRLVSALGRGPYEEFTIEVNPEDIAEKGADYAKALRRTGADRISMGVQSFDGEILRRMARRHDASAPARAMTLLREAGFGNISMDLIFGWPGMSMESWKESLRRALELRPEHISAYQLSIEEGSALACRPGLTEAPEEDCREQYELLCCTLAKAGYLHYEISNFALPGHEAKHNAAYWKRVPYVGLGPGAHSLLPGGRERRWNSETLPFYTQEGEHLSDEDLRTETLMLSLRTAAGIPRDTLESLAGDKAKFLIDSGILVPAGKDNLRIPEERFFTCDEIIRELL